MVQIFSDDFIESSDTLSRHYHYHYLRHYQGVALKLANILLFLSLPALGHYENRLDLNLPASA